LKRDEGQQQEHWLHRMDWMSEHSHSDVYQPLTMDATPVEVRPEHTSPGRSVSPIPASKRQRSSGNIACGKEHEEDSVIRSLPVKTQLSVLCYLEDAWRVLSLDEDVISNMNLEHVCLSKTRWYELRLALQRLPKKDTMEAIRMATNICARVCQIPFKLLEEFEQEFQALLTYHVEFNKKWKNCVLIAYKPDIGLDAICIKPWTGKLVCFPPAPAFIFSKKDFEKHLDRDHHPLTARS